MKLIDKVLVWIYKLLNKYFGTKKVYVYMAVEGWLEGNKLNKENKKNETR